MDGGRGRVVSSPGRVVGPSKPRRTAELVWSKLPTSAKSAAKSTWAGWARLTNRGRLLPDFIIIGTQRGGTTSLYNYLAAHPAVARALTKEVRFFDLHYDRGPAWYRAQFPSAKHREALERRTGLDMVVGEASPDYMLHPHAPVRAANLVPAAKLIVLLRDPVARAYSHYWHQVKRGFETLSFEEAIAREPERLAGELEKLLADERYESFEYHHHSYLTRGMYADQLERWMRLFPRDRFLILASEELYERPAEIVDEVLRFLGLPPWHLADYPTYNKMGSGQMAPATREELLAYFAPHNERLYRLVDRDFGWGA